MLHIVSNSNNNTNKGDWGSEVWSLGLLLTGSKMLAKVGCAFAVQDVSSLQPPPVRMGMFNLMPLVKRTLATTL